MSILVTQRPPVLPSWISTAPSGGGVTVAGDLSVTFLFNYLKKNVFLYRTVSLPACN